MKLSIAALALGTILCTSGCQQRVAGKLLGQWVGTPDTAASRAERESQKYGETASASEAASPSIAPESVTDWERYDRSITLDFVDHERVEMALSGETEGSLSGKWRVVSTTPIGCTIEVEAHGEKSETVVRRQFQLDLDEREGQCVGFTLMEVGADRQLGTLYFRRDE